MDIAFWASRWNEGRIGFHEGKANQFLVRHASVLGGEGRNVLVPLCGKSEDLAYLAARGHHVVGVEAIEDAVKQFFAEHELTPTVRQTANAKIYEAANITILNANVFAVTREETGPVDALYDRAALIALSPDDRTRYAALVTSLLSPGAKGVLVTIEYPDGTHKPPPYAVREDEVRALYKNVTLLESHRIVDDERFVENSHERCFELAF